MRHAAHRRRTELGEARQQDPPSEDEQTVPGSAGIGTSGGDLRRRSSGQRADAGPTSPLRITTGAFILNAGLGKRALPDEAAAGMQAMAQGAVPKAGDLSPATFGKALSTGEMALGAALLTPFVSPVVAGAALTAFSGSLLRMWWLTPGMHEDGSLRPTEQGTAVAKDVWMLVAGLALVADGLTDGARKTAKQARKGARRTVKADRAALPAS